MHILKYLSKLILNGIILLTTNVSIFVHTKSFNFFLTKSQITFDIFRLADANKKIETGKKSTVT